MSCWGEIPGDLEDCCSERYIEACKTNQIFSLSYSPEAKPVI